MNKMKALNLHGVGDLRYEDAPMPMAGKDEALLKVRAVGICGSDIPRVFVKGTYNFPTIIGHEFAGEVVEADDKTLVGRGFAVFPLIPCEKCDACKNGDYAQCADYDYYGSRRNGAMAEYLAVKVKNLCQIPNNVSFEEAAMTEPAAVAIHAFRKSGAKANDTILIYGIGTIGLILGEWARVTGVKNVIMVGRSEDKIEFAKKLGFPLAINTTDIKERVMEVTKGRGVDVCIEGTGVSKALEDCLSMTKNFGTVLCMGNPLGDMKLSQDVYWKILRKELKIVGTWNSSFSSKANDWETALSAMKVGTLNLKPLITHRFGLAEYAQAFDLMKERREMFCKVMFVG